MLVGPSR